MRARAENRQAGIVFAAKGMCLMLIGFLLSQAKLAGIPSPLAVSLVAALDGFDGLWTAAGAVFGLLSSGQPKVLIISQGASIGAVWLVKFLFFKLRGLEPEGGFRGLFTGIAVVIASLFSGTMLSGGLTTALITACQGLLAGCGTYFLYKVLTTAKIEGRLVLTGTAGASLGCCYVLGTAVLCSIQVGIFNLGRCAAVLVLLMAARHYKHLGGAVCGALAGCAAVLASPELGASAMLLPVAGMVAGLFGEFGRMPVAFFLVAANAVGLIVLGVTPDTARMLVDVAVGSVAFVILPDNLLIPLVGSTSMAFKGSSQRPAELAAAQLDFAAKTIGEVRKNVEHISQTLSKAEKEISITDTVCAQICSRCGNKLACWEQDYDNSLKAFHEAKTMLEEHGSLYAGELPGPLKHCNKRSALTGAFEEAYRQRQSRLSAKQRLGEVQGVLYQQLDSMGEMLHGLSEEISAPRQWDGELSLRITTMLRDFGAESPKAAVSWDKGGHMRVEAYYEGRLKPSLMEVSEELSVLTERELGNPMVFAVGHTSKLSIIETTSYYMETALAQSPASKEPLSGDTLRTFQDGRGNAYMILSDGMGTGKLAAVDSAMTVTLLIKLLKAGVDFPVAVRVINTALSAKSAGESFATLDVARINLYTGKLNLCKLGASVTFVRTGGQVVKVEANSPPVGILTAPEMDTRSASLSKGDLIVMLSDGIPEEAYPGIRELLRKDGTPLQALAERILAYARSTQPVERDDAGVLVGRLIAAEDWEEGLLEPKLPEKSVECTSEFAE